MEEHINFNSTDIHTIILFLRDLTIGLISVGLFSGAVGFSLYLFRLSRLPKTSREYK